MARRAVVGRPFVVRGVTVLPGVEEDFLRNAIEYDSVLVVGEEYVVVDRVSAYRTLGLRAEMYPISAADAPTLVSFLGVLGWLLGEAGEGKRVLVEGLGGQALVAAGLAVLEGMDARSAIEFVEARGLEIVSPLQVRLLALVDYMRRSGIDVEAEALRFRGDAFTGGDAHAATVAELALEHAILLRGVAPIAVPKLYYHILGGIPVRLNDYEKLVIEVSRSLDYTRVGAVRNVYLEPRGAVLRVYIGCGMLVHEKQCWPEADASLRQYERLARLYSAKTVDFVMAEAEEVACIAYEHVHPRLCGEPAWKPRLEGGEDEAEGGRTPSSGCR